MTGRKIYYCGIPPLPLARPPLFSDQARPSFFFTSLLAQEARSPAILEIPSKEHPYDPEQDAIHRRTKLLLGIRD